MSNSNFMISQQKLWDTDCSILHKTTSKISHLQGAIPVKSCFGNSSSSINFLSFIRLPASRICLARTLATKVLPTSIAFTPPVTMALLYLIKAFVKVQQLTTKEFILNIQQQNADTVLYLPLKPLFSLALSWLPRSKFQYSFSASPDTKGSKETGLKCIFWNYLVSIVWVFQNKMSFLMSPFSTAFYIQYININSSYTRHYWEHIQYLYQKEKN